MAKLWLASLIVCMVALGGGSFVPVGEYLYANIEKVADASGAVEIRFSTPGVKRLVIAYGRKYRKMRKDRDGTTEGNRENFKPRRAKLLEGGRLARFEKLPPDYYDIVVVDAMDMVFYEGLSLHHEYDEENMPDKKLQERFQEEIRRSLGLRTDRIGGWEGFFDHKQIERIEIAEAQSGVLMQQMRLGAAFAESGAKISGYIHSIDVVWVEQTTSDDHAWQVINRQQLYRDELPEQKFFRHVQMNELSGIRVGTKLKKVKEVVLGK